MKKCALIPLGDRVVVLPDQAAEGRGVLITPEKWRQPSDRGRVLATGLGGWDEDGDRVPLEVEVGAHVIFSRVRGMQVTIGDEVVLLLRESELLAGLP
jgi:chaperonin GroES